MNEYYPWSFLQAGHKHRSYQFTQRTVKSCHWRSDLSLSAPTFSSPTIKHKLSSLFLTFQSLLSDSDSFENDYRCCSLWGIKDAQRLWYLSQSCARVPLPMSLFCHLLALVPLCSGLNWTLELAALLHLSLFCSLRHYSLPSGGLPGHWF